MYSLLSPPGGSDVEKRMALLLFIVPLKYLFMGIFDMSFIPLIPYYQCLTLIFLYFAFQTTTYFHISWCPEWA